MSTVNSEEFKRLFKDFINEKNVLIPTGKGILCKKGYNISIARAIKEMKQFGQTWELSFILALVSDLAANPQESQKVIELYARFYEYIKEHNLNHLFDIKPYLDVIILYIALTLIGWTNPTTLPRN